MIALDRAVSIVVESGSCSPDYQRWEERRNCGHHHRTACGALRCYDRHTRSYCRHGRIAGQSCRRCLGYAKAQSCSADWYHATYHYADESRIGDRDAAMIRKAKEGC